MYILVIYFYITNYPELRSLKQQGLLSHRFCGPGTEEWFRWLILVWGIAWRHRGLPSSKGSPGRLRASTSKIAPAHGCWQKPSVSCWLLAGSLTQFSPHGSFHRAAWWSSWSGSLLPRTNDLKENKIETTRLF